MTAARAIYALPPTEADVRHLCRNARDWDWREVQACRPYATREEWAAELTALLPHYAFAWALTPHPEDPAIAFVGLMPSGAPGVMSAHMFATTEWRRVIRPLTEFIRGEIIPACLDAGVRRCEARALASYGHARRWMHRLGAEEECPLPDFGRNGEEFVQFAWRVSDVLRGQPRSAAA